MCDFIPNTSNVVQAAIYHIISYLLVLIDDHVMTLLFLDPELISNLLTIYVCYLVDISWAGMGHSV